MDLQTSHTRKGQPIYGVAIYLGRDTFAGGGAEASSMSLPSSRAGAFPMGGVPASFLEAL